MLIWLFIATRIIANPLSNLFQKRLAQESADPLFIIAATHALLTLACLPFLAPALAGAGGLPFWANMATAAALAVAGNTLLVHALRAGDLSILGPINAYKPLISLALGIFLLSEVPTAAGMGGVLLILVGSYVVIDREIDEPRRNVFVQFFRMRGVLPRLAALALSATEAVFLKRAILLSSPLTTFVLWCVVGLPIAACAVAVLLRGRVRTEVAVMRAHRVGYLWLAVTTGLMQVATLLTFGKLQVGYSLALFQLSTLISVFLGYRYFREGSIRKRLAGSMVMVTGAVMIVLGR